MLISTGRAAGGIAVTSGDLMVGILKGLSRDLAGKTGGVDELRERVVC